LPVAAARQVVRSMVNRGLIEEVPSPTDDPAYAWRTGEDGTALALCATTAGVGAIGEAAPGQVDPNTSGTDEEAPPVPDQAAEGSPPPTGATIVDPTSAAFQAPAHATLRQVARAVLDAWDAKADGGMEEPMANLRIALGARSTRPAVTARRKPRDGTKQAQVIALLRRTEGATIAQIMEATGWQSHTVRGFFAGMKKRLGIAVTAGERGKGAKGSHTVYRIGGRLMRTIRSKAPRYAIALYWVSTAEQGQSGLGLEAQQAAVRTFVQAEGWTLVAEFSDIASGKDDRRPGFQAALARCRQLDAMLVAARLDRITRRAHTLSQLLEDGVSIRTADMPGADDLMMRVYAAMAQKERELISERTRAALAAARARGAVLGGDRGYRPAAGRMPMRRPRRVVWGRSGSHIGCCSRWSGCGVKVLRPRPRWHGL
jgi:DNA invertase Pin-like site-specific DNA recombinase